MTDRLISAVPVPFTRKGEVDRPALEWTLAGLVSHVDGVLMAGTTGEFPAWRMTSGSTSSPPRWRCSAHRGSSPISVTGRRIRS